MLAVADHRVENICRPNMCRHALRLSGKMNGKNTNTHTHGGECARQKILSHTPLPPARSAAFRRGDLMDASERSFRLCDDRRPEVLFAMMRNFPRMNFSARTHTRTHTESQFRRQIVKVNCCVCVCVRGEFANKGSHSSSAYRRTAKSRAPAAAVCEP